MDGAHDMGGVAWSGPVRPEPDEPGVPCRMGAPRVRDHAGDGDAGRLEHRLSRFARENRPPGGIPRHELLPDLACRLERLMLERGLVATDEIEAGTPLHPAKRSPRR